MHHFLGISVVQASANKALPMQRQNFFAYSVQRQKTSADSKGNRAIPLKRIKEKINKERKNKQLDTIVFVLHLLLP